MREAYGKLDDRPPQWEAWFNSGPVSLLQAKAKHREWLSLVEARIANIRAERTGAGQTLSPQTARSLAGEWYGWFVATVGAHNLPRDVLTAWRDRMWEGLHSIANSFGDPFDHADVRHVRPVIADEGKTAQFLDAKKLTLDSASRDQFLDYVARDFFAALEFLIRRATGDYSDDEYAKRFPKTGASDLGLTPWALFEKWITDARPATSTVDRWRAVFLQLCEDYPNTPAAALLPEQMFEWAKGLVNAERSAGTVADVWVRAARTVFAWSVGQKLIARNPFSGWHITVPKKIRTRESKSFSSDEINTILDAALAVKVRSKMTAAERWCPWLAAYTGARMGELTQLRREDVFEKDGIWAIKISPEAGTVKDRQPRTVPLHNHLIEQGFIEFAESSDKGPLFYNFAKAETAARDVTNPKRPRAIQARERLAAWVRELGVNDPEIQPNHAWRHTFKKLGDRAGLSEKTLDTICGHAQVSTGRDYGELELVDKAQALGRFPRYKTGGPHWPAQTS